jgi:hypothetical protein
MNKKTPNYFVADYSSLEEALLKINPLNPYLGDGKLVLILQIKIIFLWKKKDFSI